MMDDIAGDVTEMIPGEIDGGMELTGPAVPLRCH